MLWFYENIFQELFQTWNLFQKRNKNENKIAYECKAKRKLKRATHKFSNEQNHKEKLQQNNFSNCFTFSLQK